MKRYLSLLKACMTDGMNIFKVSVKRNNKTTKILLPIILAVVIMSLMSTYSTSIIDVLTPIKMEHVLLTLFVLFTSIMTLIEGIYKSGSLLFNCTDDNLLFSLPIKRSTVLFVRIFKFYLFELLYNSMFLLPAMIVYAMHVNVGVSYYVVSLFGLLLFPIIPILLSCIIGFLITFLSSKFKGKNIAQTVITFALMLGIMFVSYNSENLLLGLSKNASSLNDIIIKIYYPAGAYVNLVTNFDMLNFIIFILIHLAAFEVVIILLSKLYFNINSSAKSVRKSKKNKKYVIKTSSQISSLVKKELSRFASSTVFVTNAAFGLVLFLVGCIIVVVKFDFVADIIVKSNPNITLSNVKSYMPVLLLGFIAFSSFMTSITSSMISLEGKSFNILKSLPVKPYTIIKSKVLAAIFVMIPFILLGDIIVFIRFKFV